MACVALLNGAFAWLIGSVLARVWIGSANQGALLSAALALRRSEPRALWLGLIATVVSLWSAAASMAGLPLTDAAVPLWQMLAGTAYGHAGIVGLLALACAGLLLAFRRRALALLLLLVFACSRAALSHAAEAGLLSVALLLDWLHLVLMGVWVGSVLVAASLVLPAMSARRVDTSYLLTLSRWATFAVAGIFVTGVYNALLHISSPADLGNAYGMALIIKLALVFTAAALGGYNRYLGFPAAMAVGGSPAVAMLVLRIESFFLLGALMTAAFLTAQAPP